MAFQSTSLNKVERNYEIYDRKLLAIVEVLRDWRQYLEEREEFELTMIGREDKLFVEIRRRNSETG